MDLTWISVFVVIIAVAAEGKIFEPIELAQKLHSINVSDWDIPYLVCLAHNASELSTSHRSVVHFIAERRDIAFYGVFGVPDAWLGDCGLTASALLDEDVEDDVGCVIERLSDRNPSKFDRTDYLGALTPHVVDLNKCFDWWEHLPSHYVLSTDKRIEISECRTAAPQETDTHHHRHHPNPQHKPHPAVTTTCQCDSNGGVLVDVSLIILNILLVVLCCILWASFVQRRAVKN